MNEHDKALALIAAEVASEGKVTEYAIRVYVANNLSIEAFATAINRGIERAVRAAVTR